MVAILRFWLLFLVLLPVIAIAQISSPEEALADKYFEDSEYEPALELYEKLHKRNSEQRHYVYRIAACYNKLYRFEDGLKFLEKLTKKDDKAFDYTILMSDLLLMTGKEKDAEKTLDDLINKRLKTADEFGRTGNFFHGLGKNNRALQTYLQGRKSLKNPYLFLQEVAQLFELVGQPGQATKEYIALYALDPMTEESVKMHILSLISPESSQAVEAVLLDAIQQNQKDIGLRTIVYEFYVLNESFYEAFVQVKAIDRVFRDNENGERVYQFAQTMRNNKQYKMSNKALDYIIENHPESPYFFLSYKDKTINNELEAFETVPLDMESVRAAVVAYDDLLNTFGRKASFFDAIYRKANLMAIYLNDLNGALKELAQLDNLPIKPQESARASLLTGDILLMQKEYNKASLRYNEVADNNKDEQIGALAKFKQGQLAYYKGDFEFAKGRLVSIKDNTSNDISNDAIRLNLLIMDNTGLDSTTTALQIFAEAQLLVFQREYKEAITLMDSLLYRFPNHSLTDEILWEKANIALKLDNIDETLLLLGKIIDGHSQDILADDALYLKARIFDLNLGNRDKAMDFYLQLLTKYPASLFTVDVRKRIRQLRNEKL